MNRLISPADVLAQVVAALPEEMIDDVVIIGSLAAGLHFFGGDSDAQVRTKDIDCLLSPRYELSDQGEWPSKNCSIKAGCSGRMKRGESRARYRPLWRSCRWRA